jgi:hypothetical protein
MPKAPASTVSKLKSFIPFLGRESAGELSLFGSAEQGIGNSAIRKGVSTFGHHLWGVPIATGVLAIISQWNHRLELDRIKSEYGEEIAARVGKPMHMIKTHDMERVAKLNPALHEAVRRSRTRRNLSVAVTIGGTIGGLAVGALLATTIGAAVWPLLAGGMAVNALGAIGIHLTSGVVGAGIASTLGFMGVELGLEKYGEKKLKLEEPTLAQVERNPKLQSRLSVPSQVTYLAHLQARREPISQAQVLTVFVSANPQLDAQIKARFGESFANLPQGSQEKVLEMVGGQLNIEQLTNDINNRHIRAQEISFAAYGQASGVRRFESARVAEMQHTIEGLNAQLQAQAPASQKMAFKNAQVSGILEGGEQMQYTPEEVAWRRRIDARRLENSLAASTKPVGATL